MFRNNEYYQRWWDAKVAFVEKYIRPNPTLEIGCGYGYFATRLKELGFDIKCLEGSQRNIDIMREDYPNIKVELHNAEEPLPASCDLLINFGLIYHLRNLEESFKDWATKCRYMLLDSLVFDTDQDYQLEHKEGDLFDQSCTGGGTNLSVSAIERLLTTNGFTYRRMDDPILNCDWICETDTHNKFSYDWTVKNTMQFHQSGTALRSMWICASPGNNISGIKKGY